MIWIYNIKDCIIVANRLLGFRSDQDEISLAVSPDSSTIFFTIKLLSLNCLIIWDK